MGLKTELTPTANSNSLNPPDGNLLLVLYSGLRGYWKGIYQNPLNEPD
jgi:hypothetical protein